VPRHVVERKIDAAGEPVAANVLPEVDELQPGADRVGHRHHLWIATALQRQHDPADGIGGTAAVAREVVAGRIPRLSLVLLERGDQVGEGRTVEAGAADRVGEREKHRVSRPAGEAGVEFLAPCRERDSGLRRRCRFVAEVVGPAGEGVDIGEVLAELRWHEAGGDGEVLVVAAGDGPTEGLGGGEVCVRRQIGQPPRHGVAGGRLTVLRRRRRV